ncbi:uncharacterized protein LOC107864870 [Capsicum annuum]|uniref:uncharacterized protein LOC107864870 n=1 Tax=Capsicum annuum TaxID=4072 RepID=UPI0007BEA983|nr:uncharacterized protein LOC107864870 [Capsicum annuum]
MKNHEAHLTGSAPFPEANVVAAHDQPEIRQNYYRGHGLGHDRGHGRGLGRERNNYRHDGGNKQENNNGSQNNPSKCKVNICHRCGMKGHWARTYRTPDHFVKLYQASLKRKENDVEVHLTFRGDDDEASPSNTYDDVEANLAYNNDDFKGLSDITDLKAEDFYEDID